MQVDFVNRYVDISIYNMNLLYFYCKAVTFVEFFCCEIRINCSNLLFTLTCLKTLPDDSGVKNLSAMQETWVWSLGQEDSLEKEMATHSSIRAWRIPGQRSLAGYNSRGRKESDTTERLTLSLSLTCLKTAI